MLQNLTQTYAPAAEYFEINDVVNGFTEVDDSWEVLELKKC